VPCIKRLHCCPVIGPRPPVSTSFPIGCDCWLCCQFVLHPELLAMLFCKQTINDCRQIVSLILWELLLYPPSGQYFVCVPPFCHRTSALLHVTSFQFHNHFVPFRFWQTAASFLHGPLRSKHPLTSWVTNKFVGRCLASSAGICSSSERADRLWGSTDALENGRHGRCTRS